MGWVQLNMLHTCIIVQQKLPCFLAFLRQAGLDFYKTLHFDMHYFDRRH